MFLLFYTNANQFLNKGDKLLLHISNNEPEIIMITEVSPKVQPSFVSEAQLQIPSFTLFTNFSIDRDLCKVHGNWSWGCCVYIQAS